MAWTYIQTKSANGTGSSQAVTPDAGTTIGNLVVVNVKFGGTSQTCDSVTDSAGNTYAKAVGPIDNGSGNRSYQFYGMQVASATTITANFSGAIANRIVIDEFSGTDAKTNAQVFDKASSGTGNSANAAVTSFSPVRAGELIVAGVAFNSGATSPVAGTNYVLGLNSTSISTEYRLISGTSETAPMSWTGTVVWSECAGAYKLSVIKNINGLARASIKTINGLAIASVQKVNGLQTV